MPYIDFEVGFLHHVHNIDYVTLYSNIFRILDDAKIEHEFLNKKIKYTRRHVKTLEKYLLKDLKYKDTDKIKELTTERRQMMASLRDMIEGIRFLATDEEREAIKLLKRWINIVRKDIKSRNTIYEWSAAYYMERTVESDARYKDALQVFAMTFLYNSIVKCNKEIRKLETERIVDKSTKRNTKERRRRSLKDLDIFLGVINAAIVEEDDEAEKIREAGNLIYMTIKREQTLYRFRKTLNKKKLEKKKQQEEQEKPENKQQLKNQEKDKLQQKSKDTQTGNED